MTASPSSSLALVRLLQLASPALPVGAYSYSQGLEAAIEAGTVTDAASAQRWIDDVLRHSVAALEAPLWRRLWAAWQREDAAAVVAWNERFLATRETAELRAETAQMGYSLARLLGELDGAEAAVALAAVPAIAFPAAFTFAAVRRGLDEEAALLAYLWSFVENQVMAAIKAVPLGQTQGQQILAALGAHLPELARGCAELGDDELCNFTPGLAIASSRHEAQYSRLFRS
jgi:urease accessory protein